MSLQSRLTSLAQAIGADIKSLRSSVAAAYLPVGTLLPWRLPESTIPGGWIADYGQILNRADYPDLWTRVAPSAVTDAVWLAAPYLERAKFSSGNGTTTFRMPDTNAKHPDGNTPAAAVLRGNGRNSAGTPGLFQSDQLGPMTYAVRKASTTATNVYIGGQGFAALSSTGSTGTTYVDASTEGTPWIGNTGIETRVVSATVIWCTVGASVASNPGSVDVVALASTVATQASRVQTLEDQNKVWSSGWLPWVAISRTTMPHTLGKVPDTFSFLARVKAGSAGEGGFVAGDTVRLNGAMDHIGTSNGYGLQVSEMTATQFMVEVGQSISAVILNKTLNALFVPSAANWELKILAWRSER